MAQHGHLAEGMDGKDLRRVQRPLHQHILYSLLLADHAGGAGVGRPYGTDDFRCRHGVSPYRCQAAALVSRSKPDDQPTVWLSRACLLSKRCCSSTRRVPPGVASKVTVTSVSWPRVPLSSSQAQVKARRRGGSTMR